MVLFRLVKDVFIAGDLFWYPVEGFPEIVNAPDVMVAFGRPRGDRGSYKQWEEGNVAPQVVFEILSPNNTAREMDDKFDFYEEYGVEEYYIYDPDTNRLKVSLRKNDALVPVRPLMSFISPRLMIRFDFTGPEMVVYRPDGQRFLTFEELDVERQQAMERVNKALKEVDDARKQAEEARHQAEEAIRQNELAQQRQRRMAELGRKARRGEASADELRELDQLEVAAEAPP